MTVNVCYYPSVSRATSALPLFSSYIHFPSVTRFSSLFNSSNKREIKTKDIRAILTSPREESGSQFHRLCFAVTSGGVAKNKPFNWTGLNVCLIYTQLHISLTCSRHFCIRGNRYSLSSLSLYLPSWFAFFNLIRPSFVTLFSPIYSTFLRYIFSSYSAFLCYSISSFLFYLPVLSDFLLLILPPFVTRFSPSTFFHYSFTTSHPTVLRYSPTTSLYFGGLAKQMRI